MKRYLYKTEDLLNGKPVVELYGHNGIFLVEVKRAWYETESRFYEAEKYGYKTRRGAEKNPIYLENKARFNLEIIEVEIEK